MKYIQLELSEEQYLLIKAAATIEERTVTAYTRIAVLKAATTTTKNHTQKEVSNDQPEN